MTDNDDITINKELRDTLPPGSLDDPADLMASTAIRLERVSSALGEISVDLSQVARDISTVRQQQISHGKELGEQQAEIRLLREFLTELNDRVTRLEKTIIR